MLCPRCSKDEVTPGTGLCIICATETSEEEQQHSLMDLIEKDPFEFMRQAVPPAGLILHEQVRARLKGSLRNDPRCFKAEDFIRTWCESKGHATEEGEIIDGGEIGWKRWLQTNTEKPKHPEVEPDLEAGHALFDEPNVLDLFADDVAASGLVGERPIVKLLGLAMTSRFLDRPVSIAVKGESSSGKSATVQSAMAFFPEGAYRDITAGSPLSLAKTNESFFHRMVVLYEASALERDAGTFVYMMRSLLSEDRIRYETVMGGQAVLIQKDGPTGLITTTVLPQLESQLETRLMSVYTDLSPEQTRRVLMAQAERASASSTLPDNRAAWHGLHLILSESEHRVLVPFAAKVAALVNADEVKMRRLHKTHLGLIKAHTLLHQSHRDKSNTGEVIAAGEDYAAVRAIVTEAARTLMQASKTEEMNETLEAIGEGCLMSELVTRLPDVTQPTVSRRVDRLAVAKLVIKSKIGRSLHVTPVQDESLTSGLPPVDKVF